MDSVFSFMKQVAGVPEETPAMTNTRTITYITPNIIAMGCPHKDDGTQNSEDELSKYLNTKHPGRYMIINLSEKDYDYSKFDNQVLEFRFPGYPAPPLDTAFNICNSMHGWLHADSSNVVAVHCQTGKGRTVTAIAAYLSWCGKFKNTKEALDFVSEKMDLPLKELIIPTQRRYLEYVDQMIKDKKPSINTVKLERVIMNGIPRFENDESCTPYLQIFKNAKLLYTSTGRDSSELRVYTQEDNSILFPVNVTFDGDILIRVRHISTTLQRVSMLRFGFHTGYVKPGLQRFTKPELDGACDSDKFSDDFLLDLVFRTGEELPPSKDDQFWDTIGHKPIASEEKAPEMPIQSFKSEDIVLKEENKIDEEDEPKIPIYPSHSNSSVCLAAIQSPEVHASMADTDCIDDLESFEALEAYVSGLGDVDTQNIDLDLDEDTEILFDELSKELSSSVPRSARADSIDLTELDKEIREALND